MKGSLIAFLYLTDATAAPGMFTFIQVDMDLHIQTVTEWDPLAWSDMVYNTLRSRQNTICYSYLYLQCIILLGLQSNSV